VDLHDQVAEYEEALWDSPAWDYLRFREIDQDTVRGWRLGYVARPAHPSHRRFVGRLAIPYIDGADGVTTIRFRSLDPEGDPGDRYRSVGKDVPRLFGIRYSDYPGVFIAEGEVDVLTLWQMGFKACGVPGAGMWRRHWRYLFRGGDVNLILDPDPAGMLATNKIRLDLEKIGVPVGLVKMPADVNDTYCDWGHAQLREYLQQAVAA